MAPQRDAAGGGAGLGAERGGAGRGGRLCGRERDDFSAVNGATRLRACGNGSSGGRAGAGPASASPTSAGTRTLHAAMDTPRIALAPMLLLLSVPSSSIIFWSMAAWSAASMPCAAAVR